MNEGVLICEYLEPGGIITLTFGRPQYKKIIDKDSTRKVRRRKGNLSNSFILS